MLLYANAKQEIHTAYLIAYLKREFPGRTIDAQLLTLHDVIDLAEVKTKVETWLLGHRQHEIALFFSPGIPIMQLAWNICHTSLGLNTRLLQTKPAHLLAVGESGLTEIREERSAAPMTAIIWEQNLQSASTDLATYQGHALPPALQAVYERGGWWPRPIR